MASQLALDESGYRVQAFKLPVSGKTTQLTISGTSATTAALERGIYRMECTTSCFIALGATAVVTDLPLSAGIPEYFQVNEADTVSAIGTSGTLRITLC